MRIRAEEISFWPKSVERLDTRDDDGSDASDVCLERPYPTMLKRHSEGSETKAPIDTKSELRGKGPAAGSAPAEDSFTLHIEAGSFKTTGEVVVLLGENGTGKSTFLDLLGSWLLHGEAYGHEGVGANRNTGKGAANKTEVQGLVAVKRQHPLERARRSWKGSVGKFLECSPAAQAVHERVNSASAKS